MQNAAETYNLAQDDTVFNEGLLREISQECYNGFKDDEDTRSQWLEDHTFWMSLYMQQDYSATADAERSWGATESVPLLTEACDQFQARTYKAFFPQDTFISAIPMKKTKQNRKLLEDRAERIANHMSYQLGYVDSTYKQDKDALFLAVAQHGSFFTKTYFNQKLKRFKVDNVRPTDLVVSYNVGPIRIEDVRRKSHIIYTTVGETERLVGSKYLIDAAASCQQQEGESAYNVKVNEIQGLNPGNATLRGDRPAILIEQQLYLDIKGDGEFHPYIVTFDLATRKVKRVCIGYEADQMGNPLKDFEQTQLYTHYKFKENPDGFYGLGLGHSIGDLNSAINVMLRQTMDAGTLQNDGNMSGFISERLGLTGDEIRMVLGKFIKIPDTVGDLQNSIMMMKFPGPSEALLKIMEMLDTRAQRMAATTDATTGSGEKVEQPTTYLAKVEQAMETFSSVQMRLASSLTDELQKIYHINQKYLPLVDYYMVNDEPDMVTRADYADDHIIRPIFDPKFATQGQKVARAQAISQVVMGNPLTQTRPQVMDELCRMNLEALDCDEIDILVPQPPTPMDIGDQAQENMLFMMPPGQSPPFDVFPEHNHAQHLASMQHFAETDGKKLPPESLPAFIAHKQKHEAFLYGQKQGIIPPPSPRQIGNSPLAQQPGDTMDHEQAGAAIPPAPPFGGGAVMGGAAPAGGSAAGT